MNNITDIEEIEEKVPNAELKFGAWFAVLLFIALIFAIIAYLKHKKKEGLEVEKEVLIEKGVLLKLYGVNKKTFIKWISLFCYPDAKELANYLVKRKIPQSEYDFIISRLGEPSETMPIRNKGEIVDHTEGSYETLRSNVLDNLDEIGISKEAYDSLSVFPPLVALRIKNHYQKNVENATVYSF